MAHFGTSASKGSGAVETHTIMGGKVQLYKRPNSGYWQCSTFLAGKKRRVSTHEDSLARAKDFAEDWYLELRGKARAGEISDEKTFAQAAEAFTREYEAITEGQRNEKYTQDHQSRLRNHLIPYFGALPLSQITAGKLQEYRLHRLNAGRADDAKAQTFADAAETFGREYSGPRSVKEIEGHRGRLRTQLIPYFGKMRLAEITPAAIDAYKADRLNPPGDSLPPAKMVLHREVVTLTSVLRWSARLSRPPTRSTMHHEIVTLRQVLKTAIRHGWLAHLPDFSAPYRASAKVSHRAWFSPEEYKTLYETTRAHARAGKGLPWQRAAEQLHDYVLFMANTGIRPDEASRLEYRDVAVVNDEATAETILEIEVRGKRGTGYCKSTSGAVRPFERMVKRNAPRPTDRLFAVNQKKSFNGILEKAGLKLDREGNKRTAYSLRHTYICLRLMEGADIYQIAKNCRTSVEMIEKYYAAHIKTRLDAAAINVRRPRPATRPAAKPA